MKKVLALVLAAVMCVGLLAGCGDNGGKTEGGVIKVGYVNPYTGPLAGNGEGCDWVINEIETYVNTTLGGIGTMAGPIVGSVIYIALSEILADYPGWSNIILGLIAILVILFLPDGILGTLQKKFNFEILSQKRLSDDRKPKARKLKKQASEK